MESNQQKALNSIQISTKNEIVDKIGQINFTGNIIPSGWFRTIQKEGKVQMNAIVILSEIVYWYRPSEIREENGSTITYKKKFKDELFLQKSYDQLATHFGLSKTQVKNAVLFLEELGVIKRHFRTIATANGPLPNVLFIELYPDMLLELTYPDSNTYMHKNIDTPIQNDAEVSTETHICISENAHTNTKNTPSEYNTHNTTAAHSENVVDESILNILDDLNLPTADIQAIASAANYDITTIFNVKKILDRQTRKINNVTGWIISAINNNYKMNSFNKASKKNTFSNFTERHYDFDALLKDIS